MRSGLLATGVLLLAVGTLFAVVEPERAQFHLTPVRGWSNDPNGLSYYGGEYHLFYQHNPADRRANSRKVCWGHFVSKDLVHWTDVGEVLRPDALGAPFSGSAVVDVDGLAGFGTNAHVLVYTAFGMTSSAQCLAYSTDGRHYEKYAANPVVPRIARANRDPKVLWHEPTKQWVMCLYGGEYEETRHVLRFLTSSDLKSWTQTGELEGEVNPQRVLGDPKAGNYLHECPGLEEIPVEGGGARWVVWGANGAYGVGSFDGRRFVPEESGIRPPYALLPWGCRYYAGQVFADDPKGRKVWMAWNPLETKDAPFNQGFSLPYELSLRKTADGWRLVYRPVDELKVLREGPAVSFAEFDGELAEAFFEAEVGPDAEVSLDVRGESLAWSAKTELLSFSKGTKRFVLPWPATGGKLSLHLFVDRLGLEVLSDDGLLLTTFPMFFPKAENRTLGFSSAGGVRNVSARAFRLKSAVAVQGD